MGEHDNRGAAGEPLHILLEPLELLRAEIAEPRRLEARDVDQADEVGAPIIEALPPGAQGPFAVAVEILLPAVGEDVVLAGHVEDTARPDALEVLGDRVERAGLLRMREVPSMEHEGWLGRQRVDLRDRLLHRADHVLVRLALEADVGVADLNEAEVTGRGAPGRGVRQAAGREDSTTDGPKQPRTGPGHALEESATVDAVLAPRFGRRRIRHRRSMPIAAEVVCHLVLLGG